MTDVPLTPRGEQEARAIGERLRGVSFQHVLCSPRVRARRTCELADLGPAATVNNDLQEWNYGEYEGLLTSEILTRQPGWKIFEHGCPGGESPAQIAARADRIVAAVQALDGNVALFSHGHFTRVLAARWVDLPVAGGQILGSSTGSIGILSTSPNTSSPVIALWNMTPGGNTL